MLFVLLCVNLQPLSPPASSSSLLSWPESSGIMQMLHTLQCLLTRAMHLRSHSHTRSYMGTPSCACLSLALFLSCLPYCNSGSGMWLSLMMVIAGWHGQQKLEYNCSVEMVCYIMLHISETDRQTHVQTDKCAETKICIFMS